MKIDHLIRRGRVHPVLETDAHGVEMLTGWFRPAGSGKTGAWTLKHPQPWIDHEAIKAGKAYTPGVQIVLDERRRQIQFEGYDAAHDDAHNSGDLARAAMCYEREPAERKMRVGTDGPTANVIEVPESWPWEGRAWKPSADRVRDLAKAGALYMAESDRLRRDGQPEKADDVMKQALGCCAGIDNIYKVTPLSPGPHLIGGRP